MCVIVGSKARVYVTKDYGENWDVVNSTINAGENTSGIFSLETIGTEHVIAVGGDYSKPDSAGAVSVSIDGGYSWETVDAPTLGYR